MSGVYIIGLDASELKNGTNFTLFSDGTAYTDDLPTEKYKWVFVPDHGRLIDADELMKKTFRYLRPDGTTNAACVFESDIGKAPTIIPADEEDDG